MIARSKTCEVKAVNKRSGAIRRHRQAKQTETGIQYRRRITHQLFIAVRNCGKSLTLEDATSDGRLLASPPVIGTKRSAAIPRLPTYVDQRTAHRQTLTPTPPTLTWTSSSLAIPLSLLMASLASIEYSSFAKSHLRAGGGMGQARHGGS